MYGTCSSEAMAPRLSAMRNACDSPSITQGPAIRNRGSFAPKRIEFTENVLFSATVPENSLE